MNFSRLLVCFFLILAIGYPGRAQDETPAQAAVKDPRLDQKVTLDLTYVQLSEALAQLSKQSGVAMRAGGSDREWKVAERRVSIRAKDVRLGDLMDQISTLARFRLSRGKKDGQFTYLYWQDKNQRELEADMLNSQKEEEAQKAYEIRQTALDTADKALAMTPEAAQALKDKDPWMAYLGGTKTGRAYSSMLKSIATDYPDVRDLMLRGRKATIPMKGVSPALLQATTEATQGGFMAAERKKHPDMPQVKPTMISIMPMDNLAGQAQSLLGFGGMVMIEGTMDTGATDPLGGGTPIGFFPVTGNDTMMGKLFGKLMLAVEAGTPVDEAAKATQKDFEDPQMAAALLGRKSKLETTPPTDPAMLREVEIEKLPGMNSMGGMDKEHKIQAETMDTLTKNLGQPLLLDDYSNVMPPGVFVIPGKQPFYKLLAAFEKAGYDWQIANGALLLKPTDWALRRSYMIPEKLMAYYRTLLETNGAFSLDDLAAMAVELTDTQIFNTLIADPDLMMPVMGSLGNPMGEGKEMLRLYGSLSAAQKKALLADEEVPFAQLTDEQYTRVTDMISFRWGSAEISEGSLTIVKQDEKRKMPTIVTFEFKALTPDQQEPLKHQCVINIFDKETLKQMKDSMKKAMDTMNKKGEKKDGKEPAAPTTAPSPAPK